MTEIPEQKHPREKEDHAIIEQMFQEDITDYNLAELARLRIRYKSFPGAKSLQRDMDDLLAKWDLTEELLFEKTRKIHQQRKVYRPADKEEENWL